MERIYFDYAATTPLDQRVLVAMMPYFSEDFGNPSSVHYFGQRAEAAVDQARRVVATQLKARPEEIIFTSGGSEGDNLALRGIMWSAAIKANSPRHILISPVEHHAVLHTARQMAQNHGFDVEFLPVDEYGRVDAADVAASIRPETCLVSVIYANNEVGTLNPIADIGAVCRKQGVPLHTDAVQAAAHLAMDVKRDMVDLLTVGAHKFNGPKGVGALYVRRGMTLMAGQTGGGQENGLRAGTENVPYLVGLAEAFRLTQLERDIRSKRLEMLRDRLIDGVLTSVPRVRLTGHPTLRLPNHASFVFENIDGNALLMALDVAGFACSSGSACKAGSPKPSEVLTAIGLSRNWALGSLRISLGVQTEAGHIDSFLQILPDMVSRLRGQAK